MKATLEKKNSKERNSNIYNTLIIGTLGLILALLPNTFNNIIGMLVGLILLVMGILTIDRYFKVNVTMDLIRGILYGVLGVIIMIYPGSVIRFLAICTGVYFTINGLIKIKLAFNVKNVNSKWIGTLVLGIITILLGILLIFNTFGGIALTKLMGIFLVVVAVFDLVDTYLIREE